MNPTNYNIVLEKGEAPRPFYELTEEERHEIAVRVFEHVTELAAQVGSLPVTAQNLPKIKSGENNPSA